MTLTPESTIADLLATAPAAARLLVARGMHCVGCEIAPFETIAEACAIYGVAVQELFADIEGIAMARGRTTAERPGEES